MMPDEKIKNSSELEFAVFCIENVAAKLGVDAECVYQAFAEKSDILNGYIVPEYEVLHTQSREYIVDDRLSQEASATVSTSALTRLQERVFSTAAALASLDSSFLECLRLLHLPELHLRLPSLL